MDAPMKDDYSVDRLSRLLEYCKQNRMKWEIESFINMEFVEGNHYVYYNQATREITRQTDGRIQRTVNKIRVQVRGIKNIITKNDPRWQVRSSRKIRAKEDEIKIANILLQTIWSEQDLRDKTKDLLDHALTKTYGAYFIYYDPQYKDDGDVKVESIDPFDLYLDPYGEFDGARFCGQYIIRTTRTTMYELKKMKQYPESAIKEVQADGRISESDWKARHFQNKGETNLASGNDDMLSSVILKEFYHIEDGKLRRITWAGKQILQDIDMPEMDEYPFYFYQPERRQGRVLTKAWITPTIELNKVLNRILSKLEEWALIFSTGRILQHKNSTVDNILSDEGQIVEYTGTPPQYWQMGSPGEVPFSISNMVSGYIEDQGVHGESLGRLAGSATSGIAIAQLQASDLQNIAEPIENLKTTLEDLAIGILKLASKKYNKIRNLYEQDETGGEEEDLAIPVMGADVDTASKTLGLTFGKTEGNVQKIRSFDSVDVDIIPGSAFSDMQARQDVVELRKLGVKIPDSFILDTYAIGNTADLIEKFNEEQEG